MTIVIHVLALVTISVAAYVTFGGWWMGFAEKHFELVKRMFPWLVIWSQTVHVVSYKVLTTFSLVLAIVIYVLKFQAIR